MHCAHFLIRCRRLLSVLLSCLLLLLLCFPFLPRARANRNNKSLVNQTITPPRRSGELLVRFRGGTSELQKAETANAHGAKRKGQLRGESGIEKLELLTDQNPESVALQLLANPVVEFAEPNFLISQSQLSTPNG